MINYSHLLYDVIHESGQKFRSSNDDWAKYLALEVAIDGTPYECEPLHRLDMDDEPPSR